MVFLTKGIQFCLEQLNEVKKTTKEFDFRLPWLVLGVHHQVMAGSNIKMKSHFYHKLAIFISNHESSMIDTGWSIKKLGQFE